MSFAIIETGGKQYKVSASKILEIEKLDAKIGETIKFQKVLLLNDNKTTEVGSPSVDGAMVEARGAIGQVRAIRGDYAAAAEQFRAVLQLDPGNVPARENLRRLAPLLNSADQQ